MKTVSGRVLSLKPVSLSKAARVLSKFVASDNGASPAFAAYLKRASASFDELVQLRKELKGSGADYRGKKKHLPDGIIAEETANSVKKPGQDGLYNEGRFGVSGRKEQNVGKRDKVEARDIEGNGSVGIRIEKGNSEGNVGGDSVDVSGDEKKMKTKRREGGEIELMDEKERSYGDLDAVDANGIEDHVGSEETKKKKKKKRDKGEWGESDSAVKKQDLEGSLNQNHSNGEAADVVENGVGDGKKQKKNKKRKEEKETGVAELTDVRNGGSEHSMVKTESNEGKIEKRSREEKEKERGVKVEIEEANKKDSRKRKHEGGGHGRLDDSEEQLRSKKKGRKNELHG